MNIGLLGFGVVGRGVYDMLADRDDIRAAWVLCRRDLGELTAKTTYDIQDILSDPAVDTVVEVMGGLHPAYEYVAAALRAGKNVVSSNKYLMCRYYDELNALAREHGAALRCTAAVGGGIPWLTNLEKAARANHISRVWGILNGTTNYIVDAMRRGTRLIQIDPRVNWLSARADIFIQLRAGTDTALAMAMLDIIIKEDLYDHEFVEYWCYGFEQLAERVATMPPEKAAEICQVPVEKIYAAARMYAKAKPAAIMWGLAVDQKTDGMQNSQCIIALQAITGNFDRPGGQLVPGADAGHNELGFGYKECIPDELFQKMIGMDQYPAYCNMILNSQVDLMLEALETDKPYPIRMGFYMASNPLSNTSMEPKRWHDALCKSLEFCIGIDLFMNASIQATCDIFLPIATIAEREGTVFTHYAPCTVTAGFMHKAVDCGGLPSDMELAYRLGKYLHPERFSKWANEHELVEAFRLGVENHGETFDEVSKCVVAQVPIEYYKYEKGLLRQDGQVGFATPTGRVELWSTAYNQFGEDPLPYYIEPEFSPVSKPELMDEYPLVMTSGARFWGMFHSEHRQIERMRHYRPWPLMEIHPDTAAKYGIKDGDWVWMEGPLGRAKRKAKLTPIMDRRLVSCDHGWWFPEGDPEKFYDVFDLNINNTLPWIPGKSGFGSNYKSSICKIYKVEEGN